MRLTLAALSRPFTVMVAALAVAVVDRFVSSAVEVIGVRLKVRRISASNVSFAGEQVFRDVFTDRSQTLPIRRSDAQSPLTIFLSFAESVGAFLAPHDLRQGESVEFVRPTFSECRRSVWRVRFASLPPESSSLHACRFAPTVQSSFSRLSRFRSPPRVSGGAANGAFLVARRLHRIQCNQKQTPHACGVRRR